MANRNVPTDERPPTDADAEDVALLARINLGDHRAFQALYVKYYHPLLRFIYRITGQLETAQEGVNDVMLVVWGNGKTFRGQSRVSTWIMGIAYRKALKLRRSSLRWVQRFKGADVGFGDELSSPEQEHMQDSEIKDLLEQGMRNLPVKQRTVVELTYFHGYSYEEIAAIVDCPVNTVKTRMFHARARLKALLPVLGRDDL
jgi:RNA polymerase sigma-70 factor, ECF subfamily